MRLVVLRAGSDFTWLAIETTDDQNKSELDGNSFSGDLESGFKEPTNKASQLPTDENPNQTDLDVTAVENPDHHLQHQQEVASLEGEKEPVPQGASAATDETKQKEMIKEIHKAKGKLKLKLELASFALMFGCSELLCIMFLPKNSANENILKSVSILGFFDLITAFCLLIHTSFMLARSTFTHSIHDTISKGLLIISSTALLLSLIPLLMLPSPYNLLITIVLAVVLLTLCINLYPRSKTNDKNTENDQTQDEEQTKEILRLFELYKGLASLPAGGLIGILFGIQKKPSNHGQQPFVSLAVFLLLPSFLLSVFLMNFFQMRLMHLSPSTRKNLLRVGARLFEFLVVMLALSVIAIASMFLKWYTVIIFIPVLIVCAVWLIVSCTMDPHKIRDTLEEDDLSIKEKKDEDLSIKKKEEEEDLKLTYTKGNWVATISFGGITAIFNGYLGTEVKEMHLIICMIFLASAFLCAQSLMLLSYKPSKRSHIDSSVNILTLFANSLLLCGTFTIFILEFMRL